jgi:NADPH:quinone reductase-like Zn-dependent oxidoreductase
MPTITKERLTMSRNILITGATGQVGVYATTMHSMMTQTR